MVVSSVQVEGPVCRYTDRLPAAAFDRVSVAVTAALSSAITISDRFKAKSSLVLSAADRFIAVDPRDPIAYQLKAVATTERAMSPRSI